jgi:hypothetical protein
MSGARITAHSAMCDRSMAHAGVCVLFGGAIEGGDVRVGTRVAVDLARVIRSVSLKTATFCPEPFDAKGV